MAEIETLRRVAYRKGYEAGVSRNRGLLRQTEAQCERIRKRWLAAEEKVRALKAEIARLKITQDTELIP